MASRRITHYAVALCAVITVIIAAITGAGPVTASPVTPSAASTITAAISSMGPLTASPVEEATDCAPVTVVMMAGTTETSPTADPDRAVGMLKPITDQLRNHFGEAVKIIYPAYTASAFTQGLSYTQSKDNGRQVLRHTLTSACASTKFVFGGFSQGADIAGDEASDIGNGRSPIAADRVLAVALLADPGQGASGETVVGPKVSGTGMGGNRPGGMGSLAGRVATICNNGGANGGRPDLYCSLDKAKNPFIANIASMLALTPAQQQLSTTSTAATPTDPTTSSAGAGSAGTGADGTPTPAAPSTVTGLPSATSQAPTPASRLTSQITQDWSSADLPGLKNTVNQLTGMLSPNRQGGTVDMNQVVSLANSVTNTLAPLSNLVTSGTADKTTTAQLAATPNDPASSAAASVLTTAGRSDLSGALRTAQNITDTATTLGSGTSGTVDPERGYAVPQMQQLAGSASTLSQQTSALSATPSDQLASATSVLSLLGPQKIISQVVNVVTGIASTDWFGIINTLNVALQRVFALDVAGVKAQAQHLNDLLKPLITMAAQVDFHWIAQILRAIPDPSGYTQIAATICDFIGNLDVIRLANDVGKIESIAFDVIGGNPLRLADLAPTGLDLASVAVGVLNGGTKQAVTAYAPNQAEATLSGQVGAQDFGGLINSFIQLAGSQGANDAVSLVNTGITAAQFWGTGTQAHNDYAHYTVDNSGRSALSWFADWLSLKIAQLVPKTA